MDQLRPSKVTQVRFLSGPMHTKAARKRPLSHSRPSKFTGQNPCQPHATLDEACLCSHTILHLYKPGCTRHSALPAAPAIPTAPVAPAVPAASVGPAVPAAPAASVNPADHVAPVAPVASEAPAVLVVSAAPITVMATASPAAPAAHCSNLSMFQRLQPQTVRCEPLVTMGQLTHTLIELGWTIPVVPEMDDLTVGGLVMGTGIETSSHKAGLFQHICVSYELVTADGSVVSCSETENADLFYSVPWSYGTLGFLTAVEIKMIPAERFVRVEYKPCHSLENLVKTFTEEVERTEGNMFVEGIAYSLNSGIVMTANMCTSSEPGKLNEIGRWYKPWFFKHIQAYIKKDERGVEYIPIRDYYHRHTRAIFWEIQDIIPFGNNVVFRYLLGWLVPPKVSLLKLTQPKAVKELYEKNHFIQDMLVPLTQLKDALKIFEKEVQIYPVWLCPFKVPPNPGMLRPPNDKETLYVDIGTYGVPKTDDFEPVETTRRIEAFVREVKGFQMMYADSYMTREEYREMFDHTQYDRMRERLGCHIAFPEVYDKVNRKARI